MRIFRFLFSGVFMGILMVIFSVAIAYATFIENDFDATTARLVIYNARWFEWLILLMVINFTGMIFTKKLYVKSRWNILIVHIALVIIIAGAAITRYFGFEGIMSIRNGQTVSSMLTADTYFSIDAAYEEEYRSIKKPVLLSNRNENLEGSIFEINDTRFDITLARYIPRAVKQLAEDPGGYPAIHVIVGGTDGRHDIILREGESESLHGFGISFQNPSNDRFVRITRQNDSLYVEMPVEMKQDPQGMATISKGETRPIGIMELQTYSNHQFLIKEYLEEGSITFKPAAKEDRHTVSAIEYTVNGATFYGEVDSPKMITLEGVDLVLFVGQQEHQLPFALRLDEFKLDRYPGSNSPSSFASEITLIDEHAGIERPHRIFMNNILEYKGYRFYQSSYHQDEKGTVLSVNSDFWGTRVTYLGYFLLFASLIYSFFTKGTRFRGTLKKMHETHEKRKHLIAIILLLLTSTLGLAQTPINEVSKDHARKFGRIIVQGSDGRMMPFNTMANQLMMKIHKKTTFEGLMAEQVILDIMLDPVKWKAIPFVHVAHPEIQNVLGVEGKLASYNDFFDANLHFSLGEAATRAYNKKPALRNTYDKELIKVSERINIYHNILNGLMVNILPIPDDPNQTWTSRNIYGELAMDNPAMDPMLFERYLRALGTAMETNDYSQADHELNAVVEYQRANGWQIMPSDRKIQVEVFYNKANIFKRLFPLYLLLGTLLIGMFLIEAVKPTINFSTLRKILVLLLAVGFVLQTAGLIMRWYIAGHAPWSNGYESMIYISWATILAGFIFMKKSNITSGLTAMLAGITLLTAHMSWMDPEITNLVPVLKSYWLTIHVASITSSYGFLGLASLLGFFNLCLMSFRNSQNVARLNLLLKELTFVIELSLMCGLTLLIIGNFLGAIWANESWGRYWGWDPKETWTLVTIMFYSLVLHAGLIPGMRGLFTINFLALIGFGTVLMTYFGVNFYLSGLHSYAQGDPVPVPDFVYYTLIVIGLVSLIAGANQYKVRKYIPEEKGGQI